MDAVQQFRDFVETAFRESGLTHTTFGFKAAKDPNLITELRKGREFRRQTREKIEQRIREMKAEAVALKQKPKRERAA
jgi:Asp/Glu/hydantoin racemase